MILAPARPNPSRFREKDSSVFAMTGFADVKNNGVTFWHLNTSLARGKHETMNDVVGNAKGWNDVQHVSSFTDFIPDNASSSQCPTGCINGFDIPGVTWDSQNYIGDGAAEPILSVQEILNHPKTQAALSNCLASWHDSLYNMNNANLPDVSVMLMEDLPQLSGSLKWILQTALKIAEIGRKIADLDVAISKWKSQKNFTRVIVAQREMRMLSKSYLGLEFAIKQNVRSATDLVGGIARGASVLNEERQITSVRNGTLFQNGSGILCPGHEGSRSFRKIEDVKVEFCITTESKLNIRGCKLERTLAKMMAKAGVLPQLASIWEATPYSWLLDYVFRTGLLLRYVERANHIGFSDLDIFRTAFSIHIERTTSELASTHLPSGGDIIKKYEYYERCIGADLNFPAILQWLKLPHGDQWAKAFAFFFSQFK